MSNLPKDFIARIQKERTDAEALFEALDVVAPVSLRLNPNKLTHEFDEEETVPWCNSGRYLAERPSFTKDPLFHAGSYYPQEAGSMFIDAVLKQLPLSQNIVALDLCAAPGGKSTILLDNLSDNSLLITNELSRSRAFILRDNLTRWGNSNALVTNKKSEDFTDFQGLFDLVLVDAPCSGEGMFRKDVNSRQEWSVYNAEQCVLRQSEILDDIWPGLKTGAYLIYSTCTFNPAENQKQLEQFLLNNDCEIVQFSFPDSYNLEKIHSQTDSTQTLGYACYPHKMKTEGFFFAVLRKTESVRPFQLKSKRDNKQNKASFPTLPLFQIPEHHELVFLNDAYYLVPENYSDLMLHIQQKLGCMKFGIRLGELIGNKWNPHFEYALSTLENKSFPKTELNLEKALSYLKGNPIEIEGKDGWHIVTFQEQALGFLKKIGNRTNNYYPKELRIKMEL